MAVSKKYTLNNADLKKWLDNTLIFLAPAFLIFLVSIQAGKTWEDSLLAVYMWGLNTLIDLLRKFVAGK